MKIKRLISIACLFSFFLSGCTSVENEKNHLIDVASAFSSQKTLKASDYFGKIRYVPLETTDESVIGTRANITILEDKILVTTSQKQCLLFDKKSGRFISNVGHYGEDPEGYRNSSGWVNHLTGTICLDSWNQSWSTYDLDGHFKRKIVLPEGLSLQGSFVPLDEKTTVAHTMDFFGDGIESVRVFTEDSIVKTLVLHEQDNRYNVNNIESVSVLKSENNYEVYGTSGNGTIVVHFKDSPGNAYVGIVGLQRMWRQSDQVYLKTECNDTIFRLRDEVLEPAYLLELGKYHWPYEERFNMEHDHSLMVTQILDSPDLILMRLVHRLYTDDKRKSFNAMYDKSTGELQIGQIEEGIVDDLTGFLPLRPVVVSPHGEYGGMIQAFDVVEWFEENEDISPAIEHLKSVDEDDNPVIVLMEK